MCERYPTPPRSLPLPLMAVADLRDALTALELGQPAAALASLMAIDPQSWQVIAERLRAVLRPLV